MGRAILTSKDVQVGGVAAARELIPGAPPPAATATPPGAKQADQYQDRLIKYIPGDVIAVYLAIDGVLKTAAASVPVHTIQWIVFLILLPGTWFYLSRVGHVTKWQQNAVSVVAFIVWVFSLGGPFTQLHWYNPVYGAIILPLYTFLAPIFEPTN